MTDPIRAALERLIELNEECTEEDWTEAIAEARAALDAVPEGVGLTDEEWDALVDRVWDKYQTVGYQGERFMYNSDFGNALDLVRKELAHSVRPATSPTPAAGEAGELVAWLLEEAVQAANSDASHSAGMLTWAAQVVGEHADLASDGPAVPEGIAAEPSDEELAQIVEQVAHIDDVWDALEQGYPLEVTAIDIFEICRAVIGQMYAAGADAELEACCQWLEKGPYGFSIAANEVTSQLRSARRPKNPNLGQEVK